ncbi:MAG: hypothetical protein GY950_00245, partial [bacterium]|nr:hypothetical protein [bacterium]
FLDYFNEIISAVVKNEAITLKDIPISHELVTAADIFGDDEGDFDF